MAAIARRLRRNLQARTTSNNPRGSARTEVNAEYGVGTAVDANAQAARTRTPLETNVTLPGPRIVVLALYVLRCTVPIAHHDWIWQLRVAGWFQKTASRGGVGCRARKETPAWHESSTDFPMCS